MCGCLLPDGSLLGDVREALPNYMGVMCGRVIQSSGPFNLAIVHGMNVDDGRARQLDASRMTPAANARRDLFEAMKQVVETGHGPAEQIPSMGCSIKWKA
jgi:hypothetical protein